jgi:cyanophycinase-like exopeptidase
MSFFNHRPLLLLVLVTAACALTAAPHGTRAAPAAGNYRDKNFDYFVTGNPAAARAAHTEFLLALMGGGGSVDAAFAAIARHAGGGHIVILRAVNDDSFDPEDGDYGVSFATKWGPVTSAETITFHNREAAYDPRVLAALAGADGIFLAGGDQSNYIRYWKGTPVQQALNAHVQANRPIGGSSAGLAILGHYSYTAFDGGSLESKVALPDPWNSGVTLESDFLHFRGLERVITDSHFSARARLGRSIVFLVRLQQANPGATLMSVGVDEKTALLVDGAGIGRLAAGSAGSVWVTRSGPAEVLTAGKPLTVTGVRIARLGAASLLDLGKQTIGNPQAETTESIVGGVPAQNPLVSRIMLRDVVPPDET